MAFVNFRESQTIAMLVLASSSPFRRALMENAGLSFTAQPADIDERQIEAALEKDAASPRQVALVLAKAKAMDVSAKHRNTLVVGSDQTMALDDRVFHKPKDRNEARENLKVLSGRTHVLHSAIVLVRNDEVVWEHVAEARLTMRELSDRFIDLYLDRVGDAVKKSVGGYQLEGHGIQLFSEIEGDYFTIIGLPMLPLLQKLRDLGLIDA